MRYSNAGKLKENGVVYTPIEMANYLAFEIYKYWKADKTDNICILEAVPIGSKTCNQNTKSCNGTHRLCRNNRDFIVLGKTA